MSPWVEQVFGHPRPYPPDQLGGLWWVVVPACCAAGFLLACAWTALTLRSRGGRLR